MTAQCDNASVGVLIEEEGLYLVFERALPPAGVAPVAGHVFDAHASYDAAAVAEVREELGLTVKSLELTRAGGWRANRCRRLPGPGGVGHQWQVYRATVSGTLAPSAREARNPHWLDPADLQRLTERTVACACGDIPPHLFAAAPGIEPVWVQWLSDLGIITVSPANLAAVDELTKQEG